MRFNRETFFDRFRQSFGKLSQSQVEGLNFLLDKLEADTFSVEQAAYVLATVKHETAHTFQPVKERRGRVGTRIRAVQDRYWGSSFFGRGYIQLTWEDNYRKFGIADSPDKALEPETAYMILARGMREGMFTRFKLADFVNGEVDYVNARKVVNGLDRANDIAAIAEKFERILKASLVTETVAELKRKAEADLQKKAIEPNKGVTTSDIPADETAGTPPPAPAVEVKASEVPIWTRITSLSIPAGVISFIGGIIAFAKELPPYAWVSFSVIVVAGMVIGYMVWKDGKAEAHERTKIVMGAAADREKNNLRLV